MPGKKIIKNHKQFSFINALNTHFLYSTRTPTTTIGTWIYWSSTFIHTLKSPSYYRHHLFWRPNSITYSQLMDICWFRWTSYCHKRSASPPVTYARTISSITSYLPDCEPQYKSFQIDLGEANTSELYWKIYATISSMDPPKTERDQTNQIMRASHLHHPSICFTLAGYV